MTGEEALTNRCDDAGEITISSFSARVSGVGTSQGLAVLLADGEKCKF